MVPSRLRLLLHLIKSDRAWSVSNRRAVRPQRAQGRQAGGANRVIAIGGRLGIIAADRCKCS